MGDIIPPEPPTEPGDDCTHCDAGTTPSKLSINFSVSSCLCSTPLVESDSAYTSVNFGTVILEQTANPCIWKHQSSGNFGVIKVYFHPFCPAPPALEWIFDELFVTATLTSMGSHNRLTIIAQVSRPGTVTKWNVFDGHIDMDPGDCITPGASGSNTLIQADCYWFASPTPYNAAFGGIATVNFD